MAINAHPDRASTPGSLPRRLVWLGVALLLLLPAGAAVTPVALPASGHTGFTLLDGAATGIQFSNVLQEARGITNSMFFNGSGVAAGDVDGDGWCDLFLGGIGGRSVLYRNRGNWRFEDVTARSGLALADLDVTGGVLADLDGDGTLDLVVNTLGQGTRLFRNDGKGHFSAWPLPEPLNEGKGGMTLAVGDVDGDGFLDVYVANYRTSALVDMPQTRFWLKKVEGRQVIASVNGRPVTEPDLAHRFRIGEAGGVEEMGEPDVLYHNAGGTNFVPVSFTGGAFLDEEGRPLAEAPYEWGLSAMIRDINQDGLPDIYVCNDFDSPDRIWINQGRGVFRALPALAIRKTSLFSMGVDVADINRDGFDDLFILDMLSRDHPRRMNFVPDRKVPIPGVGQFLARLQYPRNCLLLNQGDGTYAEIAPAAGVEASEWSWCPVFLDVDLDGWEDILVTNGHERDARNLDVAEKLKAMRAARQLSNMEVLEARRLFPRLATACVAFHNERDLHFREVGHDWGFDYVGVTHGMAVADLDNDGDLDVIVNRFNGPAGVYRNDTIAPRVRVALKGSTPNTRGIGARIRVTAPGLPDQTQEVQCGGRYLSSDAAMRTFAAGTPTNRLTVEVLWHSGRRSVVTGLAANQLCEIDEAGAAAYTPPAPAPRTPFFEDATARLLHQHHDEALDDYARQPLLSRKLSQLGPGVAWTDLDGDGWDDLIIASGKGGQMGVFRNDGHGGFKPWASPLFDELVSRDQTAVLGMALADGRHEILAGSSNYKPAASPGAAVTAYGVEAGKTGPAVPEQEASTGPIAAADVNGDGTLDLFVGGRVLPGRYPRAASSVLLLRNGETLTPDPAGAQAFANLGLVSGAVFSDLDGDGAPELILACEWGPIRVFHNTRGKFTDVTRQLGLADLTGWWNGVTTGDFDGDGRLDIAASNWGRNHKYQSHRDRPLRVLYGEMNGDGITDIIEAWYEPGMNRWVPVNMMDVLARRLPFLREKYQTRVAYAQSGVEEILGERWSSGNELQAQHLESTVFLNRGDHFEARVLPPEAQFAPAFGISAADLDGDGAQDLFLSQNFFTSVPGTPREDAGRGLWLKGDGQGGFRAVPARESGIEVYGEQRGSAIADFDGDGRPDIVVSQNGAETRLFRNTGGRPGLRVRLAGPRDNPAALGAALRLGDAQGWGPIVETHCGSGYWSQDSAVPVLHFARPATQLSIRWPSGKTTTTPLPSDLREVTVDVEGRVIVRKP